MAPIRLRPRFRLTVSTSVEALTGRLRAALARPGALFEGKVLDDFVVLRVPPQAQHFWSPELTLQLHAEGDGTTLVRGLFGPRPAVWTGFACCYTFAIFVSLMALLFGLSQLSLDMTPHGLWLLPLPLMLLAGAFATAMVGQGLGRTQMQALRGFVDVALAADGALPDDSLPDDSLPAGDEATETDAS